MNRKFYYLSLVSTLLVAVSSFTYVNPVKAQLVIFERRRYIQGMVKDGLSVDKAEFWGNYRQDCLESSLEQGLPSWTAESVCNCVIDKFRESYTSQQFKDVTQQAETDPAIAEKLREVGESCFEKILYEE